jgi:hypothetical protein
VKLKKLLKTGAFHQGLADAYAGQAPAGKEQEQRRYGVDETQYIDNTHRYHTAHEDALSRRYGRNRREKPLDYFICLMNSLAW